MLTTVINTISEICLIDKDTISESSKLVSDLGLNSFEMINLIIAFEERLGIEVDDDELPEFETVGDIAAYLEEQA